MYTCDFELEVMCESLSCSVDYAEGKPVPSVISLHGGGESDKETTKYLSEIFTKNGRSVVRFSHPGHGKSSGTTRNSSLKRRFQETCAVIDHLKMKEPITVIGSSMGGYIATCLTAKYNVDNLILFCPAAYTHKAWNVQFSKGFTEIIREKNSFKDTDIKVRLNDFKGEAILFMGDNDKIIPPYVTSIFRDSLKNLRFITIENCPHPIHKWVVKNHKESIILGELFEFIS